MPARTVKGSEFTIFVDNKHIIVKHVHSKGKRCRVIVPDGALIEIGDKRVRSHDHQPDESDAKQAQRDAD